MKKGDVVVTPSGRRAVIIEMLEDNTRAVVINLRLGMYNPEQYHVSSLILAEDFDGAKNGNQNQSTG
tara:strand:- start:101 stop:301 length:201 start_codon:yes stop_codon:yes gene_type:complete